MNQWNIWLRDGLLWAERAYGRKQDPGLRLLAAFQGSEDDALSALRTTQEAFQPALTHFVTDRTRALDASGNFYDMHREIEIVQPFVAPERPSVARAERDAHAEMIDRLITAARLGSQTARGRLECLASFADLDERVLGVLLMRCDGQSLKQIGTAFGISSTRVSHLWHRAVRLLVDGRSFNLHRNGAPAKVVEYLKSFDFGGMFSDRLFATHFSAAEQYQRLLERRQAARR